MTSSAVERSSRKPFRVFFFLEQGLVGAQFGFDLAIAGEGFRFAGAECARCLALGKAVIVYAFLGHESRGVAGNALAQAHRGRGSRFAAWHWRPLYTSYYSSYPRPALG